MLKGCYGDASSRQPDGEDVCKRLSSNLGMDHLTVLFSPRHIATRRAFVNITVWDIINISDMCLIFIPVEHGSIWNVRLIQWAGTTSHRMNLPGRTPYILRLEFR